MPARAARARGTATVVHHLWRERRTQRLSREGVLELRDRRARAIAEYAARNVPYYRELHGVRTSGDLERLPLLEKAVVQADPHAFRSSTRAGLDAIELRTTGSTGQPLTVYHDRRSLLANIAFAERERAVEASVVGRRYGYLVLDVRAPAGTGRRVRDLYAQATFRPLRPQRHRLSVETPVGEVLAAVERLRPAVIRSFGGYLELLFRFAARSGGLTHRPRAVVYSGDTMSPGGRELIERGFGIPVLSSYNAVECFKIAFTCEERAGFHLHEDLCHVWLADAGGEPVHDGEVGEVVISNLVNRSTVLLNYRLGDLARMTDEPCRCGRPTRRLLDLAGRVDEVVELRDGSFVYPTELWRIVRERPGILRYQLVQRAEARFELRVAGDGSDESRRSVTEVVRELSELLHDAHVEPVWFDDVPRGPGGKFPLFVPLRPTRYPSLLQATTESDASRAGVGPTTRAANEAE